MTMENKKSNLFFNMFSQKSLQIIGSPLAFFIATMAIIIWLFVGVFINFTDRWESIMNISVTIITFLIVFLIQYTQNRDMQIINLKIDELIKGMKEADNERIDLASLSDDQLSELEEKYKSLCKNNEISSSIEIVTRFEERSSSKNKVEQT